MASLASILGIFLHSWPAEIYAKSPPRPCD